MTTKKPRLLMSSVVLFVAAALARGTDHSATTIRCSINDLLDRYERDGYLVNHGYSQEHAVRRVKKLIHMHQVCKRH